MLQGFDLATRQYHILQTKSKELGEAKAVLDAQVNQMIAYGWIPVGGTSVFCNSLVSFTDNTYFVSQAMTKRYLDQKD